MEVNSQLFTVPTLILRRGPHYSFNRELDGPHTCSERFRKETILLSILEIESLICVLDFFISG
jgi:hypothetical protein